MDVSRKGLEILDNGGMRSGVDRRQNIVVNCTPELRSGRDRRSGVDRRSGLGRRRYHNDEAVERRDTFRNQDRNELCRI